MKYLARLPLPALVALAVTLGVPSRLHAQSGELTQSAPAGTEYYIGFMQNDDDAGGAFAKFMGLLITSQVSTVGTVEIPGSEPLSFSTRPGEFSMISIPRALEHRISEDTIGNGTTSIVGAVRVTSRAPVSVFVLNARHQTTGSYVAVPTSMWGTHYLPMALPNGLGERTSELMIVAGYDNTVIRLTPSATTVRHDLGIPVEITLNRGRTYFVKARAIGASADLSGSEIIASRPIGVTAGHVRSTITLDGSIPSDPQAYATQQAAMMLPDSLWGTEFASVPLRAGGDRFRVMPSRQATVVMTHYGPGGIGRDTLTLDAGEVRDVASIDGQALTGPVEWTSSAPTMIMQLRTGGRYGDPRESPTMMPLTALSALASRSAFAAPERIADGTFGPHHLTLIVRVPAALRADPAKAFRAIQLDGTQLEEAFPALAPQQIGSTDLFYASLDVASGGHALVGSADVTFAGYVWGDDGAISRDAYLWPIPTWGTPAEFDDSPPYLVGFATPSKGTVDVSVSDASDRYFSGVGDVGTSPVTTGWTRTAFNVPMPTETAQATFRATADPSGQLKLRLRDRDGNYKDTVVQESLCFKTARAQSDNVAIRTTLGVAGSGTLDLATNECGDQAHVRSITFGEGTVAVNLSARFDNGQPTTTIPPNATARLTVRANGSIPVGEHHTTMRIVVDDSTIIVPVDVVVEPPSAVDDVSSTSLALRAYPNPASTGTTFAFGRALSQSATLSIVDDLGRTVRTLGERELAGRTALAWDATRDDGAIVAPGIYLVTLVDRGQRIVTALAVVR
jgi:hypothetical protein